MVEFVAISLCHACWGFVFRSCSVTVVARDMEGRREEIVAFGGYLQRLLSERNWSHHELSRQTGIARPTITALANDKRRPSAEHLVIFSGMFGRSLEELYEAAGYEVGEYKKREETPEEMLERARLILPLRVPIYADISLHLGEPSEPVDHVYVDRTEVAGKNIEGYLVTGSCLEPDVSDGDHVVVDRDAEIRPGDIVACDIEGQLHVGRLRKKGDTMILENNERSYDIVECNVIARVVLSGRWRKH